MQRRLVTTVMLALSLGLGATAAAEEDEPTPGTLDTAGLLSEARMLHTATLLPDGRVLVTGGAVIDGAAADGVSFLASAEVWDPAAGEFTTLTSTLSEARVLHTAVGGPAAS